MFRESFLFVALWAVICSLSAAAEDPSDRADFTKAFQEVSAGPAKIETREEPTVPRKDAAIEAGPVESPQPGRKPWRAILWSPSWCGVCRSNAELLETSPTPLPFKLDVRKGNRLTGDEAAFPQAVRDYASGVFPPGTDCAGQQRGWPVWQIELADGTWGFAYHARSADDLVAIHHLKAGDPIPASTFTAAWNASGKALDATPGPPAVARPQARESTRPANQTGRRVRLRAK